MLFSMFATGVGLSVCKNLSDLMGADIHLDESFDSGLEGCPGARFVVRLNQPALSTEGSLPPSQTQPLDRVPLLNKAESCAAQKSAPAGLPETLSVLFVDDDTVLRRMFTRALKRTCPGWHIQQASNGETALRITEMEKFDIIFMDQYVRVPDPSTSFEFVAYHSLCLSLSNTPFQNFHDFRWHRLKNSYSAQKLSELFDPVASSLSSAD